MNFAGNPTVWPIAPAPLAESIVNDFSEVENAVKLRSGYQTVLKVGEEIFTAENLYYTTNEYFSIFSIRIIEGNPLQMLQEPTDAVISQRVAELLFGKDNPIGKSILLNNTDLLTVKGVIENSPTNTHLTVDYLVPFALLEKNGKKLDRWGQFDFITYVLLKEQSDANQFNTKLAGYLQTKSDEANSQLFINPLTRLYLYRNPGFDAIKYPTTDEGPIARIRLFAIIGLVILLIACINFVNLSTAFATKRAKEIGVRKVNGASRTNLILRFLGESLFQTFLATFLALIIVILLLPTFINVSGVSIGIQALLSFDNIIIYLALAITTGLIAGIYPALILSSFDPIKVIKPLPEDTIQGSGLRKVLVIVQFGLAIVFVFCILVMNRQIDFMQSRNLGFDKENIMVVYPRAKAEVIDVIADQISKLSGVNGIACASNVPVNMGNFSVLNDWSENLLEKSLQFHMLQVDDNLLNLLGIKLIEGRPFSLGAGNNEVIINETAVKQMEMKDPIGKIIGWNDKKFTIIGVVQDFHYRKLKEEILPVFIYKNQDWWSKRIFVKLEPGNHFTIVDRVVKLANNHTPGFPVKYIFLDEEITRYYSDERRLNSLINAATFLSIIISCIGLFSLTTFTIGRRKKEIGIRKVFGATGSSIILMLQRDFFKLIVIASAIAMPIGYFFANRWLQSYAYHIKLTLFYFVGTVLLISFTAFATLIYHTLKASSRNPIDTLRDE
jgi:ABC-type antimicrobial peptide transport system permease subunit